MNYLKHIDLGSGTIAFPDAIDVPQQTVIPYLEQRQEQWTKENFTIVYDDEGNELHAVNNGGFIYSIENMRRSPIRIQGLDLDFFNECEKAIYNAVLHYVEIYPAILQQLWWRSGGHVLCYNSGAGLGFHADNDVNYRYGKFPKYEHATRNVLTALIYLNDCVEDGSEPKWSFSGGHMKIPYFGIDITPKTGTIILMPANYLGAHEIDMVTRGSRYSYLAWYAQGSENQDKGISPMLGHKEYKPGAQWWLDTIVEDYESFITQKIDNGLVEQSRFGDVLAFRSRANDHDTNEGETLKDWNNPPY
jgi:hypothetical protein